MLTLRCITTHPSGIHDMLSSQNGTMVPLALKSNIILLGQNMQNNHHIRRLPRDQELHIITSPLPCLTADNRQIVLGACGFL